MLEHVHYLIRSGLGIQDYWHPHLEIQEDFSRGQVGPYPISMDVKAKFPGVLNPEGVPVIAQGKALMTTPVMVALYGLGSHDLFSITKNERYRRQIDCTLDWMRKHHVPLGEGIGWPHEMDMEDLKAPWFSCVTQGLALSLFVRASKLEGIAPWRDLASQTYLGFHLPLAKGGFSREVQEGWIYEEYPTPGLNCVFNGMCCALIGLWEAWSSGLVREAERDFREGVKALRSYLPKFDHDGWSLYSLSPCLGKPFLASPYYLRANGLLAQVIGLMAGEPEFMIYGQRWISSSKSFMRRIKMSIRIALDRAPHGLFKPQVKLDS
jgi:hypothetical protein